DVIPLIERYFPYCLDLYKAIRIAAAKSDIARLLLLYEFGGLYVDCHCGIGNARELNRLILSLEQVESIFIDRAKKLNAAWRPPEEHCLINSIIFSRGRSNLIFMICRQAFANLNWLRMQERNKGKVPYDIWGLSGPGLVSAMVLQPGSD